MDASKARSPEQPSPVYAVQVDMPDDHRGDAGIKTGEWDVGLCGCCRHCVPNCLMATCCPCISTAQILVRLGIVGFPFALVGSCFAISCGFLHCLLVWYLRAETRHKFQIPGNPCGDCCAALCCGCCAVAQVATHVKSYEPGSCSFGPPDTLPAFK